MVIRTHSFSCIENLNRTISQVTYFRYLSFVVVISKEGRIRSYTYYISNKGKRIISGGFWGRPLLTSETIV